MGGVCHGKIIWVWEIKKLKRKKDFLPGSRLEAFMG